MRGLAGRLVEGRSVDYGCAFCADDANRFFGHVTQTDGDFLGCYCRKLSEGEVPYAEPVNHGVPNLPLRADGSQLDGAWVEANGSVVANEVARRIDWLVETQLTRVAEGPDGWSTLLRDPQDGRLWELTYPSSHLHGGGPRHLAVITADSALARYRVTLPDTR